MAQLEGAPAEEAEEERLCWWPVGSAQNGHLTIGCGDWRATEMRVHPLCGCETWLCLEHAKEFDDVLASGG